MNARRFRIALALVTIGAFGLRIAYVLIARGDAAVWGDAYYYHFGANALADGHWFVDPLRLEFAGLEAPSAYHPPLYTTYLAVWSLLGLDGPLAHRLVSCMLGAATVGVLGMLGARLAGYRAGLVAAGLAAVYPHLWLNDGALLSETAAAFAIALALLAIDAFQRSPTVLAAAAVGATSALAALGRAEVLLLLPLVALPLCSGARGLSLKTRLARLCVVAAAAGVVLAPWVVYNLSRFENPVLISTGAGATLAAGACDEAFEGEKLGYWAPCPFDQTQIPEPDAATIAVWEADPEARRAYFATYLADAPDESEDDEALRDQAFDYIGDHKRRFVVVVAARVGRIWNVFRPWQNATFDGDIEGRGLGWARVALAAYYVYVTLAIAGLVVLRRAGRAIWPYLALAIVATLAAATTFGIQRYRITVDVALPVLAAVALNHAWQLRRAARAAQNALLSPDPVPELRDDVRAQP